MAVIVAVLAVVVSLLILGAVVWAPRIRAAWRAVEASKTASWVIPDDSER